MSAEGAELADARSAFRMARTQLETTEKERDDWKAKYEKEHVGAQQRCGGCERMYRTLFAGQCCPHCGWSRDPGVKRPWVSAALEAAIIPDQAAEIERLREDVSALEKNQASIRAENLELRKAEGLAHIAGMREGSAEIGRLRAALKETDRRMLAARDRLTQDTHTGKAIAHLDAGRDIATAALEATPAPVSGQEVEEEAPVCEACEGTKDVKQYVECDKCAEGILRQAEQLAQVKSDIVEWRKVGKAAELEVWQLKKEREKLGEVILIAVDAAEQRGRAAAEEEHLALIEELDAKAHSMAVCAREEGKADGLRCCWYAPDGHPAKDGAA